jgi:prenylcysteine oxidase/farnesylcysteine lyase
METQTVSSRNVVDLLLHDEFDASICGQPISAPESDHQEPIKKPPTTESPNFVFGWDC